MDSRKLVLKEVLIVAIGQMIGLALMLGIYVLTGFFRISVLLGALVGAAVAVGNFFFMAVVASVAADKAQQQDVAGGQKLLKGSYPVRLLILALILFVCGKSGYFDVLALVIPLVFVRPTLTVAEFFRKKGEGV
jgi:hypothetical protein